MEEELPLLTSQKSTSSKDTIPPSQRWIGLVRLGIHKVEFKTDHGAQI